MVNVFLNFLGTVIHPSASIADIDCTDNPEMITIESHVCIEQYARVQLRTFQSMMMNSIYYQFPLIMI